MFCKSQSPPPRRPLRIEESPESSSESGDNNNNMVIKSRHKPKLAFSSSASGEKQRGTTAEAPLPGQDRQETTFTHISHTSHHATDKQENNFLRFDNILPMVSSRKCPQVYGCRCHFSQGRFQSPGWFQPLLGSWLVGYHPVGHMGTKQCDFAKCNTGNDSYIRVEYWLPGWLKSSLLYIHGSKTSLELSLRPARVLPAHHEVWGRILEGGRLDDFFQQGIEFLLNDQREDNYGLLEVSVNDSEILGCRC